MPLSIYDGSIENVRNLSLPPSPLPITPYAERGGQTTDRIHHLVDDEVAGAWRKAALQL
jgi:hypothetical protein